MDNNILSMDSLLHLAQQKASDMSDSDGYGDLDFDDVPPQPQPQLQVDVPIPAPQELPVTVMPELPSVPEIPDISPEIMMHESLQQRQMTQPPTFSPASVPVPTPTPTPTQTPVQKVVQPISSRTLLPVTEAPVQVKPKSVKAKPVKGGSGSKGLKSKFLAFLGTSVTIFGFRFTWETLLFTVVSIAVGYFLFKLTGKKKEPKKNEKNVKKKTPKKP